MRFQIACLEKQDVSLLQSYELSKSYMVAWQSKRGSLTPIHTSIIQNGL